MPRADEPLDEHTAAKAAGLPRLTHEFLETVTLATMAMDGDDQADGIAFALACYEMAGKQPPEFGFAELDSRHLTNEERKKQGEGSAFKRFTQRLVTEGEWTCIRSEDPPKPDLLCIHKTDGEIAFEVVGITEPEIAKTVSAGPEAPPIAFWTADPTERIIRNKLGKKYETRAKRIELLVYTDGAVITPDDAIIPTISPWFDASDHPFHRVWFMGDGVPCLVWSRQ